MRGILASVAVGSGLAIAASSNAALLPRDVSGIPGVIDAYFDTTLNITWLRDANYAATTGFAVGGLMDFATAQSWASGLNINGITGWHLADIAYPDPSCSDPGTSTGFHCTGGALGYMFYTEMGGTQGTAISASHNSTYDLFENVEDASYWSATSVPLTSDPRDLGFFFTEALDVFGTPAGYVSEDFKTNLKLGWAIHTGDVGAIIGVPEPVSFAILGPGILFLALVRSRRDAHSRA